MTNCSVTECNKTSRARGWCSMHYKRWVANGDPLIARTTRGKRRSPESVELGDHFGYWTVTGPFVRQGDGQARFPCRCDCGTVRDVLWRGMREFGSCGCRQKEVMATKRKHGVGPKDPGYHRARYLWLQYKITPEQFREMLEEQDCLCKICEQPVDEETGRLDHCHETSVRRGILCHHCNVGIGHFKDDIALLESAIRYLRSP